MTAIKVWTDGACSLTHGGWAWTLGKGKANGSGYVPDTTNQRMEMLAVIRAIQENDEPIIVHSDSAYVVNCFLQEWYVRWQRNGWIGGNGPVANKDLWEQMIPLVQACGTTFVKVKGHSGDPGNDEADRLAVRAMERGRRGLT